ncbi:MAG: hypothetical protein NCW75_00660 [Phycisphaera sp.]|nr:MAG: hypothetical protein NCW75_00660 [Phycisphaera sp.]
MRPNTMRTRLLIGTCLASAMLLAQGCVFSIGGGKKEYIVEDKAPLTSAQQDRAPVVRSKADVPSFSQAENARLGKLGPDTTVEAFRKIFPEAVFRSSRKHDSGDVLIYEVRDRRVYRFESSNFGHIHDEPVFFRFVRGTLEGWHHSPSGDDIPQRWLEINLIETGDDG